jgi:hypothetical protein
MPLLCIVMQVAAVIGRITSLGKLLVADWHCPWWPSVLVAIIAENIVSTYIWLSVHRVWYLLL